MPKVIQLIKRGREAGEKFRRLKQLGSVSPHNMGQEEEREANWAGH